MKNLFFLLLLIASVWTTTGCGEKDNNDPAICTTALYNERVSGALLALSNAADDYNSPSPDNCRAYRNAAQDYLDVLLLYGTCSFLVDDADHQEKVRRAQQVVNDIDC